MVNICATTGIASTDLSANCHRNEYITSYILSLSTKSSHIIQDISQNTNCAFGKPVCRNKFNDVHTGKNNISVIFCASESSVFT